MAQKVNVVLIDDIDGSQAEESVAFALDGVSYEVDLSAKNAEKLRDSVGVYLDAARRVGGRAARGKARQPAKPTSARGAGAAARGGAKPQTAEIRAWAKDQGYEVSDRGRIPADVIEAYEKAKR